ncbi:type II secretion system F family protein [Sulfitobacter sabulilitoris]|uniref:Type II secretion system F family protein n=1 Tax=Sulfitobacter sabulilitoris TaxID=2562655 RepID=A0A5S3PK25_9RHOB|nr:type II secretion system F family protein [Sulfitobacter sabulilitoris]TMM54759.1 type II secretion system F family protein [Sulfitobacter sabulilitoris]
MFRVFDAIGDAINAQLFDSDLGRYLELELGSWRFALYAVVFLGALMAFEGLRQFFARDENRIEAVNRRINMRAQGKSGEEILALLKPARRKGWMGNLPFVGDLPLALRKAGFIIPPELFLAACGAGFVISAAAGAQVTRPLLAFAVAAVFFLIVPLVGLGTLYRKRMARLVRQLPDALDLMARGLRVGHPLNTTLQSVADEMPDPAGTEFGLVVDQVAYGEDLTEAMRQMASRIEEEDVQYLSIAINMQAGTGGDLARVLTTLSRVIRARMALRRKVKAISSEGRLTAYILSALPLAIAAMMTIMTPTYYGEVMDYPHFWPVMYCIGAAVALNAIVLFRLVNFRI